MTAEERLREFERDRDRLRRWKPYVDGGITPYARQQHDARERLRAKVRADGELFADLLPDLASALEATRDWHDEHCGCEGEACEIGDKLSALDAKAQRSPEA